MLLDRPDVRGRQAHAQPSPTSSKRCSAGSAQARRTALRSEIPAVTHVDGSARVQTVTRRGQPAAIMRLISSLQERSPAVGVLVNTSFNVRGEPIVCTPEEAFRCFMGTELDLLVAGNVIVRKAAQDPALRYDYKDAFEPD